MKLMVGVPWYSGPDEDTYVSYFNFMQYLGALQERTGWRALLGPDVFKTGAVQRGLAPLDQTSRHRTGDPQREEWDRLGKLDVALVNRGRLSMVGKAREMLVEDALEWGADYLLTWDADMLFDVDTFLRLWRHQKPVVAALAFTAREVVHPVIYQMQWRTEYGMDLIDANNPVLDYPRGQLVGDEDIGGTLAFGAGMVLYDLGLFREMPKPWFNSTGCGEDIFFCLRCAKHGIPRFVDTATPVLHKGHTPWWAGEELYWQRREQQREAYVQMFGPAVRRVEGGRLV